MHDADSNEGHLSDCSPSLAQGEELDGVMRNASVQEEAYNLSASGAPAAEAIEAAAVYDAEEIQVMEAEEGSIVRGLAQPSQPTAREVSEQFNALTISGLVQTLCSWKRINCCSQTPCGRFGAQSSGNFHGLFLSGR